MGKVRLYIAQPLAVGQNLVLDESQSHYLANVMKLTQGAQISCFDNQNGEFSGEIIEISKKKCLLNIFSHDKPFSLVPDIWLLFAPVKKDNTDFIIQKATELGIRKIIPVITRYTITDKIKKERFIANAIEAAEQCRRTDVPEISDAQKFDKLLANWDSSRKLFYMDETLNGEAVKTVFANAKAPCAVLVGPEGGFCDAELELLRKLPFAQGVSLGHRILRAETAVVAALSCWQAMSGDW